METIISACISAAATFVVCMVNRFRQHEQTKEEQKGTSNLVEYKLDELTKRVDEHNNMIECTYDIEQKLERLAESLKVANHRIEDLERRIE